MKKLSALDWTALVLTIIGALNWGLVGLFKFDLVALICGGMGFGETNGLSRVIYILVGIAGIYIAIISMNLAKKE